MVNVNLMVVFGPLNDSYFVTYGRKMHYHNMPDSLIKTFTTETDMNPMRVAWLRLVPFAVIQSLDLERYHWMHPNGKTWAAMNTFNSNSKMTRAMPLWPVPIKWLTFTCTVWYDTSMPPEIVTYIKGDNIGMKKAASITWTDDGKGYFVKLRGREGWTLDVPDEYPLQINELRRQIRDFDLGIKTILFGHAGTHVYVFERGFVAHLEGTADDKDHPLYKVARSLLPDSYVERCSREFVAGLHRARRRGLESSRHLGFKPVQQPTFSSQISAAGIDHNTDAMEPAQRRCPRVSRTHEKSPRIRKRKRVWPDLVLSIALNDEWLLSPCKIRGRHTEFEARHCINELGTSWLLIRIRPLSSGVLLLQALATHASRLFGPRLF